MARVEDKLDRVLDRLGDLPTRDQMRNMGFWTIGTVVAAMLALIGIYLTASGNLLTAFSTGTAMVQQASPAPAPQPIIIQIPVQTPPAATEAPKPTP